MMLKKLTGIFSSAPKPMWSKNVELFGDAGKDIKKLPLEIIDRFYVESTTQDGTIFFELDHLTVLEKLLIAIRKMMENANNKTLDITLTVITKGRISINLIGLADKISNKSHSLINTNSIKKPIFNAINNEIYLIRKMIIEYHKINPIVKTA